MKKIVKWLIVKLIKLFFKNDYELKEIEEDGPISKKELFFIELEQNKDRIAELMSRNKSYEIANEEKIVSDLIESARKHNSWKGLYNSIKGFNEPSEELDGKIKEEYKDDLFNLEQSGIKVTLDQKKHKKTLRGNLTLEQERLDIKKEIKNKLNKTQI